MRDAYHSEDFPRPGRVTCARSKLTRASLSRANDRSLPSSRSVPPFRFVANGRKKVSSPTRAPLPLPSRSVGVSRLRAPPEPA